MTVTAEPAAQSRSVAPTGGQLWRATRWPLAILLLLVTLGAIGGLLRSDDQLGLLDPEGFDPAASRALAQLLEAEGVRVEPVRTLSAAHRAMAANGAATLFITRPDWLPAKHLERFRGAPSTVLVAPGPEALTSLQPMLKPTGDTDVDERSPACDLSAARAAGTADMGGILYGPAGDAERASIELCYATGGQAALATVTAQGSSTTVIGTAAPFTNHRLDEDGNAALTMRLLGRHPRLVWFVPTLDDPALSRQQKSFYDLLPPGWKFGVAQVGIAVFLFALWRARRLGPVVAEPLPVVVRAAETVEGRARLYRRAGARDRAAAILRSAVRDRLVPLLGLPLDAAPHAVVDAVARRAGHPAAQVGELMYGAPPPDDAGLVRLADALDALEREVRRS